MRGRRNLNEWYAERARLDPAFEKGVRALLAGKPQRRKLSLLCDECLEEEFVGWLRNEPELFKVFTLPKGRSDEHLWQDARQHKRLIVTSDRDFLDDRRYPLHESPGVLYLEAPSFDEMTDVFVRFFVSRGFLDLFYRVGWAVFEKSKSSAAPGFGQYRGHDSENGSMMVDTLWDKPLGQR
jgi:predicted nuclease of predicted toxin-antitoxin system